MYFINILVEKKSKQFLFQGTFNMAYEIGSDLNIKNVQNLTPLTLAAKLARIEMFFHILKIEREIYWQIGKFYNTLIKFLQSFKICN